MEVFVPTAGLLGFLSVTAILAGIFLAFYNGGLSVGFAFIIVTAIALPAVLAIALRVLPKTPLGRRMLPDLPKGRRSAARTMRSRPGAARPAGQKSGGLKSPMLPSGRRRDRGVPHHQRDGSQGEPIDAGPNYRGDRGARQAACRRPPAGRRGNARRSPTTCSPRPIDMPRDRSLRRSAGLTTVVWA